MHTLASLAHMLERSARQRAAVEGALNAIAELLQTRSRALLGSYHRGVGPIPGWKQLAPSTQAQRAREGFTPNEPLLRSGQLQRSIQRSVRMIGLTRGIASVGSNLDYAVYQELGTATMVPRPFLSMALYRSLERIQAIAAEHLIESRFSRREFSQSGKGRRRIFGEVSEYTAIGSPAAEAVGGE